MSFADTIEEIKDFYRGCDKITFWFSLLVLTQLFGFIPYPPSILLYAAFGSYAAYTFLKGGAGFCMPLVLLLIYIPLELIMVNPNQMFKSWERFGLFAVLLICVSPLIKSEKTANNRLEIFQIVMIASCFVGVASFFCKFLGINYGISQRLALLNLDIVGLFGGITRHSMILGPVAGMGCLYCVWKGYVSKMKIWWFLSALCIGSVLFSASRSALMATLGATALLLYRLSGTSSKFIKTAIILTLLLSVTFPIWGFALDGVMEKNSLNIEAGSMSSSRDALWEARLSEFEKSPLWGVGFDAVDVNIASSAGGFDESTGMVESGSSWLIILSMTGLFGAVILIPFLAKTYIGVFKEDGEWSMLICAVLTLFYIHMLAEGYIYYGGSILAFLLWNTIGVAYDRANDVE